MSASEDPDNAWLTMEESQKTGKLSIANHGSK